jgi:hypothetical protein
LALAVNKEIKSKDISNRLALTFIKSFNVNGLYKGFGFKVKELYNINNISHINKCKAIRFRVNKGN